MRYPSPNDSFITKLIAYELLRFHPLWSFPLISTGKNTHSSLFYQPISHKYRDFILESFFLAAQIFHDY